MKKLLVLLSMMLLVFTGGMVLAQEDALTDRLEEYATNLPPGYAYVRLADFSVLLMEQPDVLLVDVREVSEYELGHIPNAFNVPIRTLTQNLDLLPDLDAPIVVICKGGGRAMLAATALQILGYTNVKTFWGGHDAWTAEDLPVDLEPYTVERGATPTFDPVVFEAVDAYLSNLPQGYGLVTVPNLAVILSEQTPVILDVRSPDEFANGYIEGAQHIWINEFWANRDLLPEDKDTFIVVYCGVGIRGGIVTVLMNLMGYTNVLNLFGGYNGWVAAGNPVVVPPPGFDLTVTLTDYVAGLPSTFNAVRPADLNTELAGENDVVLVDVRTVDEFVEGFIPGAINIPMNDITANLNLLPDLDANIVIYCGSGHRSALVMVAMNLLGYTNVRSMISGFAAWTAAEYPVSTDLVEPVAGVTPAFDDVVFEVADAFITSIPAGYWIVRPGDLNVELAETPPFLVDVRTDGEYANGYIAGAVHIPLADFMNRVGEIPTDVPVVLYDNPTHRSSMAMVFLRMLGYDNVRVLGGGTGGWERAGFELEK